MNTKSSQEKKTSELRAELDLCLRARVSLIVIVTSEEDKILRELSDLCTNTRQRLLVWDHADSFEWVIGSGTVAPATDPLEALGAIDGLAGEGLFLLRDYHQCWSDPRVVRKLKNLAHQLKYRPERKSIIITTSSTETPPELRDVVARIDVPPPDLLELHEIVCDLLRAPDTKVELNKEEYNRILRSALGLSKNQALRVFAKAIVNRGQLDARDLETIIAEKKQIVGESGALEFHAPNESAADIGGLGALKQWVRQRSSAFGPAARDYGLPAPKGIALIGIPGTGKSLTAKAVASIWRLPLLRFDVGALFGSMIGQSEENTRRALQLCETVAPCVLWIDEIEKSLGTGDRDGGTSTRVLGTLLSWMQEKTKPVFIIATANDISKLPPELMRRGRFDEIFFLDLPTKDERREIFTVHIEKRNREPESYELDRLVEASEGYVGAEIEQAVIDAMYVAFNDELHPAREFTSDDIATAISKLIPMSRSQRERVEELRQWLHDGRAQSASFTEVTDAEAAFARIPLEPGTP